MQIPKHLLTQAAKCACGQTHSVPIEAIVIGSAILEPLAAYLRNAGFQRILVLADEHTLPAFGQTVLDHLADVGFHASPHILSAHPHLLPDEHAVASTAAAVTQHDADSIVAVGSGVINDIGRYVSHQAGLPYVVVATAPSMDGYASTVSAMQFAGVKTTLPGQAPRAIFGAIDVLAQAPWELIQAGFGDLLGKVTSLMDWKLAHALYGEPFCTQAYEVVAEPLRYCIEHAEELRQRDPSATEQLFVGLINAGIAMAMVGNSRPCSGSEHHCSHYWDLLAFQGRRAHASHGIQVGYATQWMLRFYAALAKLSTIQTPVLPQASSAWEAYAAEFYGAGAGEVLAAQRAKAVWLTENAARFSALSPTQLVADLEPEWSLADAARRALSLMGIPDTLGFLDIDAETLRATFTHAKELRARYTIFDFLHGQERFADVLAEILDASAL